MRGGPAQRKPPASSYNIPYFAAQVKRFLRFGRAKGRMCEKRRPAGGGFAANYLLRMPKFGLTNPRVLFYNETNRGAKTQVAFPVRCCGAWGGEWGFRRRCAEVRGGASGRALQRRTTVIDHVNEALLLRPFAGPRQQRLFDFFKITHGGTISWKTRSHPLSVSA
jgi:hypothetical protein